MFIVLPRPMKAAHSLTIIPHPLPLQHLIRVISQVSVLLILVAQYLTLLEIHSPLLNASLQVAPVLIPQTYTIVVVQFTALLLVDSQSLLLSS